MSTERYFAAIEVPPFSMVFKGLTMALTRSEQLLVDALAALPPNNVYTDAGKREILTGFRLFMDRRIRHIGWEADAVLLLDLAEAPDSVASRPATVRVSKEEDRLQFRCSSTRATTAATGAATSWPPL